LRQKQKAAKPQNGEQQTADHVAVAAVTIGQRTGDDLRNADHGGIEDDEEQAAIAGPKSFRIEAVSGRTLRKVP
jgi:hypothetical protein